MPRPVRMAIAGVVALVAGLIGAQLAVIWFGPQGVVTNPPCDPPLPLCLGLRVVSGTEERAVVAIWVAGAMVFAIAVGLVAWWALGWLRRRAADS